MARGGLQRRRVVWRGEVCRATDLGLRESAGRRVVWRGDVCRATNLGVRESAGRS